MCTEIETKLKVDSHNDIVEKLKQVGAEFLCQQKHQDYYFDNNDMSLTHADTCLRVRHLLFGQTEKILLTYKGPKQPSEIKQRREIEFEVKDIASAKQLLTALGYEKQFLVEKTRDLWRLDNCEIALDQVDKIGTFVEIEGPNTETIENAKQKLGLENLRHVQQSYAQLLREKLT